jgi:G protein beta subunit-like protein
MVTSSEDGTVKIWETRSGTVQRSYSHGCPVNDVVIHPNQGEIISCDRGGSVRIWDLAENNCSHQLIPEEDVSVSSVTVASDGSTLCAGTNSVCFLLSSLKIYYITLTLSPPIRVASTSGTSYSTARRRS